MYRKIFCPVDGSEASNRGMREAILLAKDQKAQLLFLHIVDFSTLAMYGPMFSTDFDAFRESGRATLEAAVEAAKVHGFSAAESHLAEIMNGAPGEAIVEAAEKYGADLIVMGTHGRRGLSRLLMGSDASTVLGQAKVPVLLVK